MTPGSLDCLLIADDLTGACDAAVHFAARGLRTSVSISERLDATDASVIAVNTESRDLSAEAAQARLAAAASQLVGRDVRILFKKIDSTLRGNIGSEIRAALDLFECDAAVVCPAFPALNRVVYQGRLCLAGQDFEPVDMRALLRRHGLEPTVCVEPGAIGRAISSDARAVCLDAQCDRDLDAIATEALAIHRRILWAGSGGLAAALARTFARPCAPLATARQAHAARGPVLFCIGSDHAVTALQQNTLLDQRPVRMIPWERASREDILGALGDGRHVCLQIPRSQACSGVIRGLIAGAPAAALFLSGGDTASLVSRSVGAQNIDLQDEIVPGIPRGVLSGGDFDRTAVATKSGAFGNPDALVKVADYFSCPNP